MTCEINKQKQNCAYRPGIAQLHAHSQQLVTHLSVAELIGEWPGRLAGFGHSAAVQSVALGALLLG